MSNSDQDTSLSFFNRLLGFDKKIDNFYYQMQSRTDTTGSLTINKATESKPIYDHEIGLLKNKIWAAFGSSTVYYADWIRLVENATGLSTYIHGFGGASANDRGDSDNYLARDDRIEHVMSCNPDIVTIFTGGNGGNSLLGNESDFQVELGLEDRTTFYGAFAYIIKKMYSIKPDVRILILEASYHRYNYGVETGFETLERVKAVRTVADYFGLPLVPNREIGSNAYTNGWMTADNVHLSMRGAEALANLVIRKLKEQGHLLR